MSTHRFKLIPVALLVLVLVPVLACQAPAAFAQSAPGVLAQPGSSMAERLHANAVASFRQARFSEAYGRLMALADAGHAPSAGLALWMYLHDRALFGKDWDSSQEQLSAWAQLAGQPVPTMVGRSYPQTLAKAAPVATAAQRARRSVP